MILGFLSAALSFDHESGCLTGGQNRVRRAHPKVHIAANGLDLYNVCNSKLKYRKVADASTFHMVDHRDVRRSDLEQETRYEYSECLKLCMVSALEF